MVIFNYHALFTIVEFVGGIVSNSLALLSDSFHMLSDVLALALSMVAIYFASKAPTKNYTYGFMRLEIIVAFLKWFGSYSNFTRYYV